MVFFSLAASLVPVGAAPVGFGGYVGRSRVDSGLQGDESTSFAVRFSGSLCD